MINLPEEYWEIVKEWFLKLVLTIVLMWVIFAVFIGFEAISGGHEWFISTFGRMGYAVIVSAMLIALAIIVGSNITSLGE